MTEYELTDSLTSIMSAAVDIFSAYLSLVAAYLVAVYLAGQRLGALQITTISTLFSVAASVLVWAMYSYFSRAIPIAGALEAINPEVNYGAQPLTKFTLVSVMILGILACLKFMLDIRRVKAT